VISAPIIQLSMPNSAAYFELTNEGGTDDALIRVETDMAETADLHETKFDANDVAQMTPLTEVEIPAGGAAALEPGGKHLMLTGLADTVKAGDKMTLILHFQHAEPQTIEAVVQAGPAMAHGDDDHAAQAAEEQAHEHDEAATAAETHELEPGTAAQRFQAAITTYLMDTAGFHAMDDRLNLEGLIDPADAGVVQRVNGLLAATTWPADLSESAHDLTTVLDQYDHSLAADDHEAAKTLAAQAHEVQHDFSHSVSHWLEGNQPPTDEEGSVFDAVLVTYLMDTAGFHAMDERLNNEGLIDPADAGVVQRVRGLVGVTAWPAELAEAATSFTTVLDQYAEALAADTVETATPLAAQVHEIQHDLSHNTGSWLSGGHGHD
jgi:copper(I)-binding protein